MLIDGGGILSFTDASKVYNSLFPELRIATLSPEYVMADAKRDANIQPIFWCYREGDQFWLQGLHKLPVPNSDYFDLQSPYGYGGPISNIDNHGGNNDDFFERAWDSWRAWCIGNDILVEFVRLHPMLDGFQYYGAEKVGEKDTAVISLDDIQYSIDCRQKIRKASKIGLKTIEVEPELILSLFVPMYRGAMKALGADSFYMFSDEYFLNLSRMKNCHYLVCYAGSSPVASALFLRGAKTLEYHLAAGTDAGRKGAAANQIIATACAIATAAAMDFVYLGGGTNSDPENSLLKFKASFTDQLLPYQYGYCVHRPDVYEEMKKDYPQPKKVLFYR